MAFLASKNSYGENEILSLHGGLTLNIQKQLEVNFKQLITGVQVCNISVHYLVVLEFISRTALLRKVV